MWCSGEPRGASTGVFYDGMAGGQGVEGVRKGIPKEAAFELALKAEGTAFRRHREWHSRRREQHVQRHGEQPEMAKMRGQTGRWWGWRKGPDRKNSVDPPTSSSAGRGR